MSNQSSSRQGEQRKGEKQLDLVAENSHIEPALAPPPPPIAASSSSSLLPPTAHDSPITRIISSSSSGDLIADQIAQLFSLADHLSSEKEALKAQVDSQLEAASSSIARLSKENDFFRRTIEDQDRVIAELSRAAIPDGHWIWESEKDEDERARGKEGRWLFSLEKYKQDPSQIAAGPPTSLLSLPVELLKTIFELVEPDEERLLLPFFYVSFRVAEVLSPFLYKELHLIDPKETVLYFEGRTSADTPRSPRITSLFVPHILNIGLDSDDWSDDHLQALERSRQVRGAPLDVDRLRLYLPQLADLFVDTTLLSSVARFSFNPVELDFVALFSPSGARLPSSSFIPLASTSFLPTWTHLKKVRYFGEGSIVLIEGDEKKETVFSRHWRAGGQGTVRTQVETSRQIAWGGPENSVTTVEVGVTPYEWVAQYVGGGVERKSISITEEVGGGEEDGDVVAQ